MDGASKHDDVPPRHERQSSASGHRRRLSNTAVGGKAGQGDLLALLSQAPDDSEGKESSSSRPSRRGSRHRRRHGSAGKHRSRNGSRRSSEAGSRGRSGRDGHTSPRHDSACVERCGDVPKDDAHAWRSSAMLLRAPVMAPDTPEGKDAAGVVLEGSLLVLRLVAGSDGRCHWKRRWCTVTRDRLHVYRSAPRGDEVTSQPMVWLRLRDISKVLRITDRVKLPGTDREVFNCWELHAGPRKLFFQARTLDGALEWMCSLFELRGLSPTDDTPSFAADPKRWRQHRTESGGCVFFRRATGEFTTTVRDMSSGRQHIAFVPPPPVDTGGGDGADGKAGDGGRDERDGRSEGKQGSQISPSRPRPSPFRRSDTSSPRARVHRTRMARTDARSKGLTFKPSRRPDRTPTTLEHRGGVDMAELAGGDVDAGLLGRLVASKGDHRGLHALPSPSTSRGRRASWASERSGVSHRSYVSRDSDLSSGGAPGLGMLMLQLHGGVNTWAGSRRNLYTDASSASPGPSPKRGHKASSAGGHFAAAVAEAESGAAATLSHGDGKKSVSPATARKANTWFELWDSERQWPYYVNAHTHKRQWEWPEGVGVHVVHWEDGGGRPDEVEDMVDDVAASTFSGSTSMAASGSMGTAGTLSKEGSSGSGSGDGLPDALLVLGSSDTVATEDGVE